MKKLLNTLYITSQDAYLGLEGECVTIKKEGVTAMRLPLHNLEAIVAFNYVGASPALLRKCGESNVSLSLFQGDNFCGRFVGQENGNVLLRKTQYRFSDTEAESLRIAINMILGKVHNERYVLERALRDHAIRVDAKKLQHASELLQKSMEYIRACSCLETLRGYEGEAASVYFGVFDELILQNKESFRFEGRNKRPPLDRVNALLSFTYALLANECAGAAYSVGLDPYVGFLHRDRPGRKSLALDLMEELRSPVAERFVLTLINKRQLDADEFSKTESGAVIMTENARKIVIQCWQEMRQEVIQHPFLKEKVPLGLLPYVQAMLLARYLRGDLDAYPPFFKR
ncbi:MAG: type I-C CRISPR-associated endonuclease Cas1c [Lachnospiraceae bacterium]|nr:type I-C CRISPR-associated endonuclease Cas1c [Lachnospiraceae bacterium]